VAAKNSERVYINLIDPATPLPTRALLSQPCWICLKFIKTDSTCHFIEPIVSESPLPNMVPMTASSAYLEQTTSGMIGSSFY
jgi:hypothetical protein